MSERVFLAFTDMSTEDGVRFMFAHKQEVKAAHVGLDAQFQDDKTILRLTLPEDMEETTANNVFPEFVWMPVQGQVVPVQHTAEEVDIDTEEANSENRPE